MSLLTSAKHGAKTPKHLRETHSSWWSSSRSGYNLPKHLLQSWTVEFPWAAESLAWDSGTTPEHGVVALGLQALEPKLKPWCSQLGESPSFKSLFPRFFSQPTQLPSPSLALLPQVASEAPHIHSLNQLNKQAEIQSFFAVKGEMDLTQRGPRSERQAAGAYSQAWGDNGLEVEGGGFLLQQNWTVYLALWFFTLHFQENNIPKISVNCKDFIKSFRIYLY